MILFEDEHYLVVDKPASMFVHPPPTSPFRLQDGQILTKVLKQQLGLKVFPIHRTDYATSGLLLLAKAREFVEPAAILFREHKIRKQYWCVVRGFIDASGQIDIPLETNFGKDISDALTFYKSLAQVELPVSISKRYATSRYSLVLAEPHTGRWHQIRRHFDRIAHPLIGDVDHGDTAHNRYFRDELKINGLCLRASYLQFPHPLTGQVLTLHAPVNEKWQKIFTLFDYANLNESY